MKLVFHQESTLSENCALSCIYRMIKSDYLQDCVNGIQTFQTEGITHGRTSISFRLRQTIIKQLNHLEYKSINLKGTNINNEALRGRLE